MKTITFKNRQKILAILAGVIITTAAVFTLVIEPEMKKQKTLKNQLVELKIELTRAKRNILIKDRIEKLYQQAEPLIAADGSYQQQISDFARLLDQLYSKSNLEIKSVKILPPTNETHYSLLSIKIETNASIKDFIKFVLSIEKHSQPIRIEKLDLKAQDSRDNITVSLVISKIVQKNDSKII
ncbi:MAG: hypothetical protein H8D47_00375 [Planctomycetes bacterium]|nr:hypothetical protein [Planctomycetota bacterium]MBL7106088.1 hypothetical protein [Phycisphaerae bacterium]